MAVSLPALHPGTMLHLTAPVRASLVALGVLSLAGCAQTRGSRASNAESLLSQRPTPLRPNCVVADQPPSLPRVDAVVDSSALELAVRDLWRERRLAPGYAILSVTFDQNGWNARREVIEHDLAASVADSLQSLFFAHRRTTAPGPPWGARLRIDLHDAPAFRMGRQEICPPRLRSAPELGVGSMSRLRSPREALSTGTLQNTVWARVLVDERGAIADAQVEPGRVPARWESLLLNYVYTMTFDPATVDGIPVSSWTRVPISLRPW